MMCVWVRDIMNDQTLEVSTILVGVEGKYWLTIFDPVVAARLIMKQFRILMISAEQFDKEFDEGGDVIKYMDLTGVWYRIDLPLRVHICLFKIAMESASTITAVIEGAIESKIETSCFWWKTK